MLVFDFLSLMNPQVTPQETKIHLASWNGIEDPLDVYLAGNFDEWQRWQKRRNFERRFVLSLIKLQTSGLWLFAGLHLFSGSERSEDGQHYNHKLSEDLLCAEMSGRLVASLYSQWAAVLSQG